MLPSSLSFVFFFSSDDHSVSFQQGRATISPVHAGGLAHSKWSCGLQSRLNRSTLRTASWQLPAEHQHATFCSQRRHGCEGVGHQTCPARSDPRLDVLVMVDDAGEHRELGRLLSPNRRSLPLSGISWCHVQGTPSWNAAPHLPFCWGDAGDWPSMYRTMFLIQETVQDILHRRRKVTERQQNTDEPRARGVCGTMWWMDAGTP
jgi:hypothetical protein